MTSVFLVVKYAATLSEFIAMSMCSVPKKSRDKDSSTCLLYVNRIHIHNKFVINQEHINTQGIVVMCYLQMRT